MLTAAGERLTARAWAGTAWPPPGPVGAALDALVGRAPGLIRTEFGRFTRQVSGYSLEHLLPENGADLAKFLVGTEGTLAVITGATVRAGAVAEGGRAGGARLPGHARGRRRGARAAAAPAGRARGHGRAAGGRVPRPPGRAAVPALPRGQAWLFVETAGDTEAEARAAAERLIADAGCLDSLVVTGAPARALWRIREDGAGLGGRTPAGAPAWPGWEDAAVPPGQLGAYLRDFAALHARARPGRAGLRPLRRRLRARPHRLPVLDRAGPLPPVRRRRGAAGRHVRRLDVGRARRRPGAQRAAARHVLGRSDRGVRRGQGDLRPGQPAQPRRARRPGAAGRGPAGAAGPAAGPRARLRLLRTTAATCPPRCTAASGVGKCRADTTGSGGVMCPSYLATRDEKDSTRGRARVLQELANGTLVARLRARRRWPSRSTCACPARAARRTARPASTWPPTRPRCCTSGTGAGCGRRPTTRWAGCPAGPGWHRARPGWPTPRCARPGLAGLAKRLGGIDPAAAAAVRRADLPRLVRRPARGRRQSRAGTPVLLWVDTFTDHFTPEVGRAAVRVLEAAGYAVRIPAEPVCCGLTWISTGQLDGAAPQLRRTAGALWTRRSSAGIPIVGLEPSCTAVLRSDARRAAAGRPARPPGRGRHPHPRRAARRRRLGATRPRRRARRGPAALPPPRRDRLVGRRARCSPGPAPTVTAVGGCCGLAGNFGVERGHYDVVGRRRRAPHLLPAVERRGPDAVLLADGFSCRTQLDQLAGVTASTSPSCWPAAWRSRRAR